MRQFVVVMMSICLTFHAAAAQTKPAALRLNTVLALDTSRAPQFDEAWAILQAWAHDNEFPFYTPQSQAGSKRLLTSIIRSHGDIDVLQSFLQKALASENEELLAAISALQSIVQSHRSYVSRYDFELSYSPPGSYVGGFHHVETCRYQSENRAAIREALKAYGALWAASGQKSAFHITWVGLGGSDLGVEIRKSAKTPEQRRALDYQLTQTLEPAKVAAIETRLYQSCDSVETIRWMARPDLLITIPKT